MCVPHPHLYAPSNINSVLGWEQGHYDEINVCIFYVYSKNVNTTPCMKYHTSFNMQRLLIYFLISAKFLVDL